MDHLVSGTFDIYHTEDGTPVRRLVYEYEDNPTIFWERHNKGDAGFVPVGLPSEFRALENMHEAAQRTETEADTTPLP
ncbi:hypothetical protein [Salinibacter phage M8CC-19]|uniref:Uncharacterized protein n=2 Tax=Kryptosalinivirus M8CC19 TaxID=2560720 RepID=A0A2I6UGC6_9CAUD|nr:hypothetical protein FGG63_gp75 [Salinibacter phage M8CC-19]AUO79011.1 hypothetical protein [Salinibacter phage M8CC-19]AUO79244.1 hypothetical protein [Salinibacter phage M31CC-1]